MKKLFLVAIVFVTFSGSALASDVNALFTLKSSTHLSLDQESNEGFVYAYIVRLPNGSERYVQGYDCAVEFAEKRGGTIVGGATVKDFEAWKCVTLDINPVPELGPILNY